MMRIVPYLLLLCLMVAPLAAQKAPITDDWILDQVRMKITRDVDAKGGGLDVSVKDGVVTLRGRVDKDKQKEKVEKLAKKVKGVKQVVNEVRVAPPGQ
jgi:hyperosmotically inducible protein